MDLLKEMQKEEVDAGTIKPPHSTVRKILDATENV